jgi:DNA-binding MarR family transcriptional regulator
LPIQSAHNSAVRRQSGTVRSSYFNTAVEAGTGMGRKSKGTGRSTANAAAEHDELAISVLAQFREVFRAAKLHFAAVQRVAGISGAQLWALSELHEKPGLRVSDLTQKMSLHQSTVSNLVEKLSGAGLILRVREDGDRRVVRLQITNAGKKVIARAPKPARGVLPDVLAKLDNKELAMIHRSLEGLVRKMKVRAPDASKTHLENI